MEHALQRKFISDSILFPNKLELRSPRAMGYQLNFQSCTLSFQILWKELLNCASSPEKAGWMHAVPTGRYCRDGAGSPNQNNTLHPTPPLLHCVTNSSQQVHTQQKRERRKKLSSSDMHSNIIRILIGQALWSQSKYGQAIKIDSDEVLLHITLWGLRASHPKMCLCGEQTVWS